MNTFKHREYFEYDVQGARSNNCVLINAKNWLANTSNDIIGINSRGGIANNYITEILDVNIEDEKYKGTLIAGDIVMLTSVASRLYTSRTFSIPVKMDNIDYTDIPVSHIVGKFTSNKISLPTFKVLANFVMLEEINNLDSNKDGFMLSVDKTKTVCKVYQVGPQVTDLKAGDVVLIKDNVATETMLGGRAFSIVSEDVVVGVFQDEDFEKPLCENLVLRYESVLMDEHQLETASIGSILELPQYDASKDEGMSALYNETTYKVLLSTVPDIRPDDLVYTDRAATSYVTYRGKRYYTTRNIDYIMATIRD